jgi:hypothetical protein
MAFNWRESSVSLIEVCGGVIPCFVGGAEKGRAYSEKKRISLTPLHLPSKKKPASTILLDCWAFSSPIKKLIH